MKFKIFYSICLIVYLLYPFVFLYDQITLRHIVSITLLIWLIVTDSIKMDSFLWAFLVFVFFYGVSSAITGYTSVFINKLFGTYVSCMAIYCATKQMILKYEATSWIINTLLIIAVLDAVVTIGQFFNLPFAKYITDTLGVTNTLEYEWQSYEHFGGALMGRTASGLIGSVLNGYFLSAATLLALYNKKGSSSIANWLLCIFLFLAVFFTQERTGFYAASIGIIFYALYCLKKNPISIVFLLVLVIPLLYYSRSFFELINYEDTRYGILGTDLGGRSELSASSLNYLLKNPLGGAMEYIGEGNREPHNFIANALLYGGIFGGIVITIYIFYQVFICLGICVEKFRHNSYGLLTMLFASAYIIYTLNSSFHNPSLPTGSEMFYVWWGGVIALKQIDSQSDSLMNNS